jgi:hypothetical protein
LNADSETWEALTQSAGWFVFVGTGTAVRPETDPLSLYLIRLLQLRLAAAGRDAGNVATVIAATDAELPATVEDEAQRVMRYFFLATVLIRSEVRLPLTQIVAMSLEYIQLSDGLTKLLPRVRDPEFQQKMLGPDGEADMAGIAGFTLTQRILDLDGFAAVLEACELAEPGLVRRLLWFMGGREPNAQFVFDRTWLAEGKSATPNWPRCRAVFEHALALGKRCELPGLAQGAARGIMRLVANNFGDAEQALRRADQMRAEIGSSPGQDDERASILLDKGDATEALEIWRELLPRWQPTDEFELQQVFSHRLAAIAAAKLGLWLEAADWLGKAWLLANETSQAVYRAGLLIDDSFARWKGGDPAGALERLAEGLTAMDRLPADEENEQAYLLRKRVGHTVMWIAQTTEGKSPTEFMEPPPACCSGLEPVNEPRVPSTPSDNSWAKLLEFEFAAGLGDAYFRLHEARLKASRYGMIRLLFDELRMQHRLRRLALDDVAEVAAGWAISFDLCRVHYQDGLEPSDALPLDLALPTHADANGEIVLGWLLAALFAVAARGALTRDILEGWRASAARAGQSPIADPWLAFVAGLFVDNTISADAAVRDSDRGLPYQLAASIRIAVDPGARPGELLSVHHLWTGVLPRNAAARYSAPDMEHLVTHAWLRLARARFLLRTPALTGPALENACASAATGWAKIGEVLLAACDAVPSSVPRGFREGFERLRQLP